MTAGCGVWKVAAFEARKFGGGAMTELCSWGAIRVISAASVRGRGGIARRGFFVLSDILSDQATMLGSPISRFNGMRGGVTMVCERLSASGGTEMMGWRESSGSALADYAFSALRVSSGGRYSEGW